MKFIINGRPREAQAATLAALLAELGYAGALVATALNETFVPASGRCAQALHDGDDIEIVAPMQGG